MVEAIVKEIENRHTELKTKSLTSIYFGGGTPSLLDSDELGLIFEALAKYFTWDSATEITLEANPDDLTTHKLSQLKSAGINRLSIGIQSFDEEDLVFMNRAHNAQEASECIDKALDAGFERITADLIYGSQTTTDAKWQANVEKMLNYKLPHISAYCLTVEEGTALHHFVANQKAAPVDNEKAIRQFTYLMDTLQGAGYEHYEISNFALPERRAVHNTNYWKGLPYLGLGPAAHSYDGQHTRKWNIGHNAKYIKAISLGEGHEEQERLTQSDLYNEYILTSLRTIWGISTSRLQGEFAQYWEQHQKTIVRLQTDGLIVNKNGSYLLTKEGKFLADNVSMQLFANADMD